MKIPTVSPAPDPALAQRRAKLRDRVAQLGEREAAARAVFAFPDQAPRSSRGPHRPGGREQFAAALMPAPEEPARERLAARGIEDRRPGRVPAQIEPAHEAFVETGHVARGGREEPAIAVDAELPGERGDVRAGDLLGSRLPAIERQARCGRRHAGPVLAARPSNPPAWPLLLPTPTTTRR